MSGTDNLEAEAAAFDSQIAERIAGGHVPDLRRVTPCDWFRTNAWRRPYFADLDFGEIFRKLDTAIRAHGPKGDAPHRVLEIGCGPGHISLELARVGHDVTGLELSPGCIDVARGLADSDPWAGTRGRLDYIAGDLFSDAVLPMAQHGGAFDAVVMVGSLHHFPDQAGILDKVVGLLAPGGIVLAHEPTRDRVTRPAAILNLLVRLIASAGGNYREPVALPEDGAALDGLLEATFRKLTYEDETGGKAQSPNDNEAGYRDMLDALQARFAQVDLRDTYGFYHEVIGGLDFDDDTNRRLAWAIRELDSALVQSGAVQASEFFYVGRRKAV